MRYSIAEVRDASGKWLSNSPDITFTDKSGLGAFPTGSTITFTGGAKDKCVRNGQASIEFRSYNAGTVTIEATSGNLTPASVTITVLHSEPSVTVASTGPALLHSTGGPREIVVTGYGNRIVLPADLAGKTVAVSLYDMRGRLIGQLPPSRDRVMVWRDAADVIAIARMKVIK